MGTPQFSVPCLEALINSEHDVVGLVCQPDKKQGRKMLLTSPPTKLIALEYGISILQPASAKEERFVLDLIDLKADLFVTCAYGKILPETVLAIPAYGCINVHASLLPAFRGAAPIQWAIIKGYNQTGITTMITDKGMDTGAMLLKETVNIDENMNAEELHDLLMALGPNVLLKTLKALQNDELEPITQDEKQASNAPMLKKEDGNINWNKSSTDIHNLVRGTYSWPGAFTLQNQQILKICKTKIYKLQDGEKKFSRAQKGEIVDINKDGIVVACGNGFVTILEIQSPSGKRMDAVSFVNGHKVQCGDRFEQ